MERLTFKAGGFNAFSDKGISTYGGMQKDGSIIYIGSVADKLAEYEYLEEQKKLLKLPCALGDMVWDIDFGRPCSYEVTGFSFGSMNDDDWEEERILDQVVVYYTNSNGSITGTFAVSEIGKTVFLTREESEAALKELERGKGE